MMAATILTFDKCLQECNTFSDHIILVFSRGVGSRNL